MASSGLDYHGCTRHTLRSCTTSADVSDNISKNTFTYLNWQHHPPPHTPEKKKHTLILTNICRCTLEKSNFHMEAFWRVYLCNGTYNHKHVHMHPHLHPLSHTLVHIHAYLHPTSEKHMDIVTPILTLIHEYIDNYTHTSNITHAHIHAITCPKTCSYILTLSLTHMYVYRSWWHIHTHLLRFIHTHTSTKTYSHAYT